MPQKTLDRKTDCRKEPKTFVKFTGKNTEMIETLKDLKKRCPCIKVTVNKEVLQESEKDWGEG